MNKQIDKFPTIIIYEIECHDAFLAAFTFRTQYSRKPDLVFYTSDEYAEPLPSSDYCNKIVIILGFTYPKDIIKNMIKDAQDLLIIDNTDNTAIELTDIDEDYKFIDTKQSISEATWELYNKKKEPLPLLYKYVKSYALDIHIIECPKTDIFHMTFDIASRNSAGILTFDNISTFLVDTKVNMLIQTGILILTYRKNILNPLLDLISFCPFINNDEELLVVGYLNIMPNFIDDIVEQCFILYPFLDFFAGYYVDSNTRCTKFYLRSTEDRIDVREIGKIHGSVGGTYTNCICILPETTCRLNYVHVDPEPFMCLYHERKYQLTEESIGILQPNYRKLLRVKFPEKSLKLELK